MKYICSATLKHLPAQPKGWLGFMARVLQINAEQQKLLSCTQASQHQNDTD